MGVKKVGASYIYAHTRNYGANSYSNPGYANGRNCDKGAFYRYRDNRPWELITALVEMEIDTMRIRGAAVVIVVTRGHNFARVNKKEQDPQSS